MKEQDELLQALIGYALIIIIFLLAAYLSSHEYLFY